MPLFLLFKILPIFSLDFILGCVLSILLTNLEEIFPSGCLFTSNHLLLKTEFKASECAMRSTCKKNHFPAEETNLKIQIRHTLEYKHEDGDDVKSAGAFISMYTL